MKETDQLKNLFESLGKIEQLNEYYWGRGDRIADLDMLNLFADFDEHEEMLFPGIPEWEVVKRKYAPVAKKLTKAINMSEIKLDDDMIRVLEDVYYEGSDMYESLEDAVEYFPKMYDKQIAIIMSILKGTFDPSNYE